ncbi:MAG: hypothetical protein ABIE74_12905 [Pseudomonadota bacterium]
MTLQGLNSDFGVRVVQTLLTRGVLPQQNPSTADLRDILLRNYNTIVTQEGGKFPGRAQFRSLHDEFSQGVDVPDTVANAFKAIDTGRGRLAEKNVASYFAGIAEYLGVSDVSTPLHDETVQKEMALALCDLEFGHKDKSAFAVLTLSKLLQNLSHEDGLRVTDKVVDAFKHGKQKMRRNVLFDFFNEAVECDHILIGESIKRIAMHCMEISFFYFEGRYAREVAAITGTMTYDTMLLRRMEFHLSKAEIDDVVRAAIPFTDLSYDLYVRLGAIDFLDRLVNLQSKEGLAAKLEVFTKLIDDAEPRVRERVMKAIARHIQFSSTPYSMMGKLLISLSDSSESLQKNAAQALTRAEDIARLNSVEVTKLVQAMIDLNIVIKDSAKILLSKGMFETLIAIFPDWFKNNIELSKQLYMMVPQDQRYEVISSVLQAGFNKKSDRNSQRMAVEIVDTICMPERREFVNLEH